MASLWVYLDAAWKSVVTGSGTSGKLAKWTGTYTQGDATNTDTEVADAVTKKHAKDGDTALGAVGTKNPPIDADKAIYRDSTASDALVTSTWTQVKAFLKTYFDTIYAALSHAHAGTDITSGTIDGDRLPTMSASKKGGVPATGAPSGKYLKDDGTFDAPAGTGAVATDPIWDAKGDLAVGTGANTAAKLTVGADDLVLTAASGEATGLKWAAAGGGLSVYWRILIGETVTVAANLEYLIGSGVLSMAGTISLGAGTNLCVINGGA